VFITTTIRNGSVTLSFEPDPSPPDSHLGVQLDGVSTEMEVD